MPPENEPPKIPSFKSPVKKEEERKGGVPPLGTPSKTGSGFGWGLGKAGGSPAGGGPLKVRGLGTAGNTLVERLKNLRKKDVAFILAGLSVLCMAPVAEHFLMSPEDQRDSMQGGFDRKGPLFPDGSSVYEAGTGGFSPGSLIGAGGEIITPLNVRDPAALVMGPGAQQKPAAVVAPPPAPTKPDTGDWKNALAEAASAGTRKAVEKAKLPMPNAKLAGAIRGLSALSGGGTGANLKLAGLDASKVPNVARDSGALTRSQAAPGFKGAASRSPSSGGGPEALKAGGNRQADIFNRGGAANALDTANATGVPQGGAGAGGMGPGDGAPPKDPSNSNIKENKQLGESLAYLKAKMEMEKALDLKWKKKEWKEFGRQKMIEETLIKSALENIVGKGIFEPIAGLMADGIGNLTGGDPTLNCLAADGAGSVRNPPTVLFNIKTSQFRACKGGKGGDGSKCPMILKGEVICIGGGGVDPNAGQDSRRSPTDSASDTQNRAGELDRARSSLADQRAALANCESSFGAGAAAFCTAARSSVDNLQAAVDRLREATNFIGDGSRNAVEGLNASGRAMGSLQAANGNGIEFLRVGGLAKDKTTEHEITALIGADAQAATLKGEAKQGVDRIGATAADFQTADQKFAEAERLMGATQNEQTSSAGLKLKAADGLLTDADANAATMASSLSQDQTTANNQQTTVQAINGSRTQIRGQYDGTVTFANEARQNLADSKVYLGGGHVTVNGAHQPVVGARPLSEQMTVTYNVSAGPGPVPAAGAQFGEFNTVVTDLGTLGTAITGTTAAPTPTHTAADVTAAREAVGTSLEAATNKRTEQGNERTRVYDGFVRTLGVANGHVTRATAPPQTARP